MIAWVAAVACGGATVALARALSGLAEPTRASVWRRAVARKRRLRLPWRRVAPASGDLPGFLLDLAASVRLGIDLPMALRGASRRGRLGPRIDRAVSAYDLGAPFLEAMEHVLEPEGAEGDATRRALAVFMETGGQVAPMLALLAESIERRRLLRRELQARSAESRYSAWALAALPPLLVAVLSVWFPATLAPLWTTPGGNLAAMYGLLSWLVGAILAFWLTRPVAGTGVTRRWPS